MEGAQNSKTHYPEYKPTQEHHSRVLQFVVQHGVKKIAVKELHVEIALWSVPR